MPLGILFWVLLVITFLVGCWGWFVQDAPKHTRGVAGLLTLILITLLGWAVFGPVVSSGNAPTSTYRSR